jgi:hypothetical protein
MIVPDRTFHKPNRTSHHLTQLMALNQSTFRHFVSLATFVVNDPYLIAKSMFVAVSQLAQ